MADNASRDSNFVPTLLAVSSADGTSPIKVYADANSHRLLTTSTTGVVTGPASSTNNAIARWSGTNGSAVKNSTVLVSDAGVMTVGSSTFALLTDITISLAESNSSITPVADGTYTVGNMLTPSTGTNGTITVKNGIIIAIQQAQ